MLPSHGQHKGLSISSTAPGVWVSGSLKIHQTPAPHSPLSARCYVRYRCDGPSSRRAHKSSQEIKRQNSIAVKTGCSRTEPSALDTALLCGFGQVTESSFASVSPSAK